MVAHICNASAPNVSWVVETGRSLRKCMGQLAWHMHCGVCKRPPASYGPLTSTCVPQHAHSCILTPAHANTHHTYIHILKDKYQENKVEKLKRRAETTTLALGVNLVSPTCITGNNNATIMVAIVIRKR